MILYTSRFMELAFLITHKNTLYIAASYLCICESNKYY